MVFKHVNPIALRTAKTLWSFGRSEYIRVKDVKYRECSVLGVQILVGCYICGTYFILFCTIFCCRNQVLSNELKSLKKQLQQLLQKNQHDDELIEALMVCS